ncbi:MAG TPA: mechanosensitive ion channel [Hyphomicrobiaceae bacterium]|nr:mechanosensitive ion channel [Hyphomicrobiaceae bacterium]
MLPLQVVPPKTAQPSAPPASVPPPVGAGGGAASAPPAAPGASTPPDPLSAPTDLAFWQRWINDGYETVVREIGNLVSLWTLVQGGLIILAYLVAATLARILEPRLEARLRTIHNQPRLLRALIVPLRRLQWILFALLLWLVVIVMRAWTWPSRSYLIAMAASLAAVWVVISILSRLIRNRSLANLFAIAAWSTVALVLVGLADDVARVLDAAAIPIGETRLSLLLVLKGALLLGIFVWLASFASDLIERRLGNTLEVSPTAIVLIGKTLKGAAFTIAILAALSLVGVDLTAFAVFSGALGIGIGIGLQKLASNLLSGVIILLDRSIKPGDVITVGDTFGSISSLNARYVSVVARNGVEYLVPNETFITEPVVNWSYSDRFVRVEVRFGVSYDSDPHEVRRIAVETVKKVARVKLNQQPVCHITGFGDSSVDFVLRFWIEDPQEGVTNVRGNVYLALWDAFKEANIAIPFPHREVIIKHNAGTADLFGGGQGRVGRHRNEGPPDA